MAREAPHTRSNMALLHALSLLLILTRAEPDDAELKPAAAVQLTLALDGSADPVAIEARTVAEACT